MERVVLFTKRYAVAIKSGTLKVEMGEIVRSRIWKIILDASNPYEYRDDSGWGSSRTTIDDAEQLLLKTYGHDGLTVRHVGGSGRSPVRGLEEFVKKTFPPEVLDAVEAFHHELGDGGNVDRAFEQEVNEALAQESYQWRLSGGRFFEVASEFIETEIQARSLDLLGTEGFHGAIDEIQKARGHLAAGSHREAIAQAAHSMESVLKGILDRDDGNVKDLLDSLDRTGFFDDIPKEARRAFSGTVLLVLATMANKLGRHGQGKDEIEPPRQYAELAVNLAATLSLFLTTKHIARRPKTAEVAADLADEIPF